MKKVTVFCIVMLVFGYQLFSQADCVPNTIALNNAKDYCSGKAAESNSNVPPNTGTIPGCWDPKSKNDVWYKFTAIASDVTIDVIKGGVNGTIKNVNIAFMSSCTTIDACKTGTPADTLKLYKGGLIIGATYYIRVSSPAVDAGTYTLCVHNTNPGITPAADCDKAVKLCNKDQVNLSQLSGAGNNSQEIEGSSCFGSGFIEQNSYWYYWTCSKAGKLTFDLTPLDATGDLDFIVYEVNGTDICSSRSIIRCDAAQCVYGGKTGLNLKETDVTEGSGCGNGQNEYLSALDMQVGKTYALFINDAVGKSGFTINFGGDGEFQGAEAKIVADKISICEGESVTFNSKSIGDTLIWTFPGGTPYSVPNTPGPHVITYNKAGKYTASLVAKTSRCHSVDQVEITVISAPHVTVANVNICPGTSATLTATLKDSTGSYTYVWAPDGEKTPSITKSPTATTVYTVTVSNGGVCTGKATGIIDVNSKLSVNAGKDTTICTGSTISLNVEPYNPGYTYKWTASAGTLSDPTIHNPTGTSMSTTTYIVTVTTDKGCSGSDTVMVFIDPLMTPVLTAENVKCNAACDGKITVAVTGGTIPYTYKWTGGCTTAVCSSLCPNVYTVIVEDKIGCTFQSSATITEPAPILLQMSSVSSICGKSNGEATVVATGGTSSGGYTYLWDDAKKQTTATATGLLPQRYCVLVKDANGCEKTACIDVPDKPGIQASLIYASQTSCNGVCDGSAEVTVNGGTLPYSYSWNTTPGAQITSKATGLCAGDYIATVSDAAGCVDTIHVKIRQPKPVILDPIPSVTICIGGSATITAVPHGGEGNYMYDWKPESLLTTPSIVVSPIVSTDYHLTVKDSKGCFSAPIVIKINVNPPLKVIASNDVKICAGDSTTLVANGSGGNGGPYKYAWYPSVSGGISGNSLQVKPLVTTTYTVIIKDDCGTPAAIDSVKVLVKDLPVVKFTGDPLSGCSPIRTLFTDSSFIKGNIITSWKWDFGDGDQSDLKNPLHVFSNTGRNTASYSVTLTVMAGNGCMSSLKKDKMIQVYPLPIANFESPVSISILNPVAHFTNNSIGATNWNWNFGDSLCSAADNRSSQYNPNHIYSEIGRYWIRLKVKNNGGCMDSTVRYIDVDPQFVIYIPNAFTPNEDGRNDVFFAKGQYINEFEMRIFDRWGNMIYYADSIDKPWNGKVNNSGELVQQDVYVYQINIKDNKDRKHQYIGSVTLIKGE